MSWIVLPRRSVDAIATSSEIRGVIAQGLWDAGSTNPH